VQQRRDLLLPGAQVGVGEVHRGDPAVDRRHGGGHLDRGAVHDDLPHPVHAGPAADPGGLLGLLVPLAGSVSIDDQSGAANRGAQLPAGQLDLAVTLAQHGVQHQRGDRCAQVLDLRQDRQRVPDPEPAGLQRVHQPWLGHQRQCGRGPSGGGRRRRRSTQATSPCTKSRSSGAAASYIRAIARHSCTNPAACTRAPARSEPVNAGDEGNSRSLTRQTLDPTSDKTRNRKCLCIRISGEP